jgi:4-hydroxy-3-polyprenylbenzoate decarboxylase
VLGITGASGAPYAVRLIETLARKHVPLMLIVSSHGWRLLEHEAGLSSLEELQQATGGDWSSITVYDNGDRGALPASGSAPSAGMVVCPCSMGTMSAIAQGSSRSLVERAADVTLKERRPLILVPRETPFSLIHLRNMTAVTEAGGTVIAAAPGFYHKPQQVGDLVDRLGIISDTHGKLRPEVFEVFSQVDHILHGGDVGPPDILTELEALAPVTAVFGNTDSFALRDRLPKVAEIELDGFLITVTHGDQFGSPNPRVLCKAFPTAEIIVYGHTHKPMLELVNKVVTVMNPGSAGPARFNARPSVGIMELEPGIPPRARLVEL